MKYDLCPRGHELTPENTMRRVDKPRTARCRICQRASAARSAARKRGEVVPYLNPKTGQPRRNQEPVTRKYKYDFEKIDGQWHRRTSKPPKGDWEPVAWREPKDPPNPTTRSPTPRDITHTLHFPIKR